MAEVAKVAEILPFLPKLPKQILIVKNLQLWHNLKHPPE